MNVTNADVLQMMPPKYGLFGLLFAFMNRLQAVGDTFYQEITCKQFFLLACMSLYKEDAPTANQLAETMGCSRQNVKQILDSLIKKGLLELKQDSLDKRKQRIYCTEKCNKMREQYYSYEAEFMSLLFNGISDEETVFVYKVISKMENNLKEVKK